MKENSNNQEKPQTLEHNVSSSPYFKVDSLDKKYKPLILKWLSNLFNYPNYPHSFKDQWITWNVWDGELSISLDSRQVEQIRLLSLIHPRFIGRPQNCTLKVVNEKSFYLELKQLIHINYPEIKGSKIIKTTKHKDNDGDVFYTYKWEVYLSDSTSIVYNNQKEKMDMVKGDFVYNSTIQERAFTLFLQGIS